MFLRDIANIRTGLVTARKQAKGPEIAQKTQDYRLLSLKCIKEPGVLDLSLVEPYTTKEPLKEDELDLSALYEIAKKRRITPQSLLDNALRPYGR